MRDNDRATDCQSHAQPMSFGRVESIENPMAVFLGETATVIGDDDFNVAIDRVPGLEPNGLWTGDVVQRIKTIADEIDDHLFNLDAINADLR